MISKNIKKLLILILIVLLFLLGAFTFISYRNPKFEFITYLSGSSTFIVAILTILYVLTTSKQLDIMTNQLKEMKKDRELQSQPLPYIENIKIESEKPRFFYCPPTDEYSFQSRYKLRAEVNNLSDSPAICIDVLAYISIPTINDKLQLETVWHRIDVLGGKCKTSKRDAIDLLYSNDFEGKFFEALRSERAKTYPHLYIKCLYRNVSGGCFTYENEYYIKPNINKEDIIKGWHTEIASFAPKYKEKLSDLKSLHKVNAEKWKELFDEVKDEVACGLTDDVVELGVVAIPGKFNIMSIEVSEYEQAIKNNSYHHFLGVGKKK